MLSHFIPVQIMVSTIAEVEAEVLPDIDVDSPFGLSDSTESTVLSTKDGFFQFLLVGFEGPF